MSADGHMRIGELARRTGVSTDLLRAWERRYGLLRPARTEGGFRLYAPTDVDRVAQMQEHLARGLAAAEAARLALAPASRPADAPAPAPGELLEALLAFDDAAVQAVFDRLLAAYSLDAVLRDSVLPALRELGERWARGEVTVAQEHFASHVLRGRLLGLARGWGSGLGPRAVLACVPGEHHDLALIVYGLALRSRGWRIAFLGADTPVETLAEAARSLVPEIVVVSANAPERLEIVLDELRRLSRVVPVRLAGPGASQEAARRAGARLLEGDPVAAASA